MIGALIVGGTGVLLLILLVLVIRRESTSEVDLLRVVGGAGVDQLPPREVLDRIFDPADLEFAAAERSPALVKLLGIERRRLALLWLGTMKREVFEILAAHRRGVRHSSNLKLGAELRFVLHVVSFYSVYVAVSCLIAFYGAFWMRVLLGQLLGLCGRLSQLRSDMLADIGPARAPSLG